MRRGMPEQSGDMHEIERQVKSDHEQPEVPFADRFIQHATGHLGEPIVKGAKDREEDSAHNHVVKVRDDKIGIAELPIERSDRERDAGQAAQSESETETPCRKAWAWRSGILPPHMVAIQLKILMPVGTATSMVRKHEESVGRHDGIPTVNI